MTESNHHSRNGFLTSKGLEETAQRSLEGLEVCDVPLTGREQSVSLDSPVSVSGLRRDEIRLPFDDELIDNQYRRFLGGL